MRQAQGKVCNPNWVIVSAFYAFQDTKTPVKIATTALMANFIFSLALMGPLKHGGLALALSLASTLQFCLLVFFLKRKMEEWGLGPILVSMGKSICASVVMGITIYILYSRWSLEKLTLGLGYLIINLAGLILIGVIVYFIAAWILRCTELASVLNLVKPFVKKRTR